MQLNAGKLHGFSCIGYKQGFHKHTKLAILVFLPMLVNVKLDIRGHKGIIFQGYKLQQTGSFVMA